MIRFLLDADTCVYAMDPDRFESVSLRLAQCEVGTAAVSAITFAEVGVGVRAGKPPAPAVLAAFIRAVPIIGFDEAAAQAYANLPFCRARFDRLLAAHALSIDATIVTNNLADFAGIPGLNLENWAA
ncbi:type II toxin-antitoxin system VapC family toxin [Qipengyuania sediminis]|uniref:type II toxin-antitoxin system VapC family toxin n=1 Tax=Qipengyuania sediminis TaxID=1532023 RepID=UPI0019801327|nr:type II toxin-antitoxin system VapC family toxin [Qipengyuania sediminis]